MAYMPTKRAITPTRSQASFDSKQVKISHHTPCDVCVSVIEQKYIPNDEIRFAQRIKYDLIKSRICGCQPSQKNPTDFNNLRLMVTPTPEIYATRSSTYIERALVFSVARIVADNCRLAFYCAQLGKNVNKTVRDSLLDVTQHFNQTAFELLPEYLAKSDDDKITLDDLRNYGMDAIITTICKELSTGVATESLYINMHKNATGCLEMVSIATENSVKIPVSFVRALRFKIEEIPMRIESADYQPYLFAIIGDVVYAVFDSTLFNISYLQQKIVTEAFRSHNIQHIRCVITTDMRTRKHHITHYY